MQQHQKSQLRLQHTKKLKKQARKEKRHKISTKIDSKVVVLPKKEMKRLHEFKERKKVVMDFSAMKKNEVSNKIDEKKRIEEAKENVFYIEGNFKEFYSEGDILGEGCVGVVRRVQRVKDNMVFASKMVRTKGEDEVVANVIREFKQMRLLKHENIVAVYELYVDLQKKRIYTIMELVEAKEMFDVLAKLGQYSEHVAAQIFRQILTAIQYLHAQLVCHRDLKPNNILCSQDGSLVKITDFNVSKFGRTISNNSTANIPQQISSNSNQKTSFTPSHVQLPLQNNQKTTSPNFPQIKIPLFNDQQTHDNFSDSLQAQPTQSQQTFLFHSPFLPTQSSLLDDTNPELIQQHINLSPRQTSSCHVQMWTYTGTVAFSAPEIFSGDSYDESVDMWSAGVVLYTMLAGYQPFEEEYLQDLIAKIQKADYSFPADPFDHISIAAKDLISRCFLINPRERITPDEALKHQWIQKDQNLQPLRARETLSLNLSKLLSRYAAYKNLGLIRASPKRKQTFCPSMLNREISSPENSSPPLSVGFSQEEELKLFEDNNQRSKSPLKKGEKQSPMQIPQILSPSPQRRPRGQSEQTTQCQENEEEASSLDHPPSYLNLDDENLDICQNQFKTADETGIIAKRHQRKSAFTSIIHNRYKLNESEQMIVQQLEDEERNGKPVNTSDITQISQLLSHKINCELIQTGDNSPQDWKNSLGYDPKRTSSF